jgi:hypothetical protein
MVAYLLSAKLHLTRAGSSVSEQLNMIIVAPPISGYFTGVMVEKDEVLLPNRLQ